MRLIEKNVKKIIKFSRNSSAFRGYPLPGLHPWTPSPRPLKAAFLPTGLHHKYYPARSVRVQSKFKQRHVTAK